MKIQFENIGKVAHGEIEIKSISVITGINNSGKSTAGKLLYSLTTSLFMMQEPFLLESKYNSIYNELDGLRRWVSSKEYDVFFEEYVKNVREFRRYNSLSHRKYSLEDSEEEAFEDKMSEITSTLIRIVEEIINKDKDEENNVKKLELGLSNLKERFETSITDERMIFSVFDDILSMEFSNSLISEYPHVTKAMVELSEDNGDIIRLNYENGLLSLDDSKLRLTRNYSESFYFDDPFLLDEPFAPMVPMGVNPRNRSFYSLKHRRQFLKQVRSAAREKNYFDSVIQDKKITEIFSKILDGEVFRRGGSFAYQDNNLDNPIGFDSLSAGMKSFSIMQMLIENGLLNNSEYLILDEPETHLHPEWQLKFAELIVLVSINFPIRVLVTSHSPYFIEAIDIYSKKYKIDKDVKFYHSQESSNGLEMIQIEEVTDNLEDIYQEMYLPLNRLEELRDDLDL